MIMVSEAVKNSSLKKFPVVCGHAGLENEVLKTGIIDYEFVINGFMDNNHPFEYGDFLISSLMFTNGDESQLYAMVEKLIELGVSALAVKNVFFKSIPESVIELCNEKSFPIILFDNTVYFEEIINEVDNLVQLSDWINKNETHISSLINNELSRYEVEVISRDMGTNKKKYALAYYMKPKIPMNHLNMKRTINNYVKSPYYNENNFLLKHRQNFVIVVTADEQSISKFEAAFNDILSQTGLNVGDFCIGTSSVYNPVMGLDYCIKEALWSWQVASIMSKERKRFAEIGSWSVLISNQNSRHLMSFMENYLGPFLDNSSDSAKELLKTVIAYVECEGNSKLTSERLNIHENTFRYRMNKIREKLGPNDNDYVFYENTSLAVKIYLLNNQKNKLL